MRRHNHFCSFLPDHDARGHRVAAGQLIDLHGRRVLPGLCDNHTHVFRGGLNFNMELRWNGVWSLADPMGMLKRQVTLTPLSHA